MKLKGWIPFATGVCVAGGFGAGGKRRSCSVGKGWLTVGGVRNAFGYGAGGVAEGEDGILLVAVSE